MEIHSYTILHYGKDYVGHALASVYDRVDALHVVYTPHPSHGHRTDAPPPEARDEVLEAVLVRVPDDGKLHWREVDHIWDEGPHRDYAVEVCRAAGADLVLVVDCDEVWRGATLDAVLRHVWRENSARNWLVNFTHLWRSFGWCVRDDMWPVRVLDLRREKGTAYVPKELGEIHHFGYAVRDGLMRYKWRIHGHKGELRPGWWAKWEAWPPAPDCHPTCADTWHPEPYDRELLPELMREHPFYDLEKIA